MNILGVDPGLSGGLALIGDDGILIEPMPVVENEIDLAALTRWIRGQTIGRAYLEKVSAMPKQGVSSTFKFGDGYGSVKGILTALGVPFELVTPQRWMKVMHVGASPELPSKARSALVVSRLFPNIDMRASPRCRKAHEGMVDALLLAEYGRRLGVSP